MDVISKMKEIVKKHEEKLLSIQNDYPKNSTNPTKKLDQMYYIGKIDGINESLKILGYDKI